MYQIRQPKVTRLPDFFTIFLLSIQRFRPTTDFGEFPLAHDSIPQLILEKPQVILDTPQIESCDSLAAAVLSVAYRFLFVVYLLCDLAYSLLIASSAGIFTALFAG